MFGDKMVIVFGVSSNHLAVDKRESFWPTYNSFLILIPSFIGSIIVMKERTNPDPFKVAPQQLGITYSLLRVYFFIRFNQVTWREKTKLKYKIIIHQRLLPMAPILAIIYEYEIASKFFFFFV